MDCPLSLLSVEALATLEERVAAAAEALMDEGDVVDPALEPLARHVWRVKWHLGAHRRHLQGVGHGDERLMAEAWCDLPDLAGASQALAAAWVELFRLRRLDERIQAFATRDPEVRAMVAFELRHGGDHLDAILAVFDRHREQLASLGGDLEELAERARMSERFAERVGSR